MPLRTALRSTPYIIGASGTPATLTADFADNQLSFPTEAYNGMKLYISYTPAQNARELTIQVEYGIDDSSFYPESVVNQAATGEGELLTWLGTIQGVTLGTEYKRAYRVPVDSSYVRVSVKEDGVGSFGTVNVLGEFKI